MAKTPAPKPVHESAADFAEHERTYDGFIKGTKWVVIATVVMMVILYFLINP